jgi:hypothetical protein
MNEWKKNTLLDPSKDINLEENMKELCMCFCIVTNYIAISNY